MIKSRNKRIISLPKSPAHKDDASNPILLNIEKTAAPLPASKRMPRKKNLQGVSTMVDESLALTFKTA